MATLSASGMSRLNQALVWAIASAVGLFVGLAVSLPFGWGIAERAVPLVGEGPAAAVAGVVFGLGLGLGLGVGQGLVLRMLGGDMIRWLVATVVSASLGMVLLSTAMYWFDLNGADAPPALGMALVGALVGGAQSLVLRQSAGRTVAWILISALALLAGLAGAVFLGGEGREGVAMAGAGALYGIVSAAGMYGARILG